jgi:hypothetical protein
VIGWKERLDFPAWGLRRVRAKVDTGACTSALGAVGCELLEVPGVGTVARLHLAPNRRRPNRLTVVEAQVLKTVVVSNSGGVREVRPVVEAEIRLGPVCKRIRLTVTSRDGMRFPMLLGREALGGDFVVDVSRSYLLSPLSPRGRGGNERP